MRFQLSPLDIMQVDAVLFEERRLSITSTRRFSHHDTGSVNVSWTEAGLGMQLTSARQLYQHTHAEAGVVLGPWEDQHVSLSVRHETDTYSVKAQLQCTGFGVWHPSVDSVGMLHHMVVNAVHPLAASRTKRWRSNSQLI